MLILASSKSNMDCVLIFYKALTHVLNTQKHEIVKYQRHFSKYETSVYIQKNNSKRTTMWWHSGRLYTNVFFYMTWSHD